MQISEAGAPKDGGKGDAPARFLHGTVAEAAWAGVTSPSPEDTVSHARAAWEAWQAGELTLDVPPGWAPSTEAGFPTQPVLVDARDLPRRKTSTREGRLALLHAVAHIEHNAIKLALDAAARFGGLPAQYYGDWLRVAAEEAHHFTLVRARLQAEGADYGAFPAHDGLWALARRTAGDLLSRMALVPRVAEARGLDVNPGMQQKLAAAGDVEAVAVLEVILADEIGHVRVGDRWFRWECERQGLDPEATFRRLLDESGTVVRPPFNTEARTAAGFTADELARLAQR